MIFKSKEQMHVSEKIITEEGLFLQRKYSTVPWKQLKSSTVKKIDITDIRMLLLTTLLIFIGLEMKVG